MKKGKRIGLMLGWALGLAFAGAAADEGVQLRDVHALCESAHPGYSVVCQETKGDQTAMVLQKDGDNILCIAEWDAGRGEYTLTVDNTNAVYDGEELPSLLIDSGGDALFITYLDDFGNSLHLHSSKTGGVWGPVDSIYYEPGGNGDAHMRVILASVHEGMLRYRVDTEDENGNILRSKNYAPIPVGAAFEQGMLLAEFNLNTWDADPFYGMHHVKARSGFMEGLLPDEGGRVLCADLQTQSIPMLVEDKGGETYLYIAEWDGAQYALFKSVRMPDDAGMDAYHTGDSELYLGTEGGARQYGFARDAWGAWRLDWLWSEHELKMGYHCVWRTDAEVTPYRRNDGFVYGRHAWNALDGLPDALPDTLEEAADLLDQSAYALVNNPDPADRLHLRAAPEKGAKSLGKFYNRTPVQVLERGKTWTHVRIGREEAGLEGYMMTQYLAFDEGEKAALKCAFPTDVLRPAFADGIPMLREPRGGAGSDAQGVFTSEPYDFIIGVVEDEWYVVMREDGSVGYILQEAFYEGNG